MNALPYGLGMRGIGTWSEDLRPKTPREGMLFLYPNGKLPLTAITGMLQSKPAKDPMFSWWSKGFPMQGGAVSGVYNDNTMLSAYTAGANAAGKILYVKVAADVAKEFRSGHVAELRTSGSNAVACAGHVVGVLVNGNNSCITLSTIEATVADTSGPNPVDADYITIIGNAVPEGGSIPNAVNYNPVRMYNYVQQFWTPYEISTMAEDTEFYFGDALKEEKREKFELHGIEMEKAYLFGRRLETTDIATGRPIWYTMGVIPMIRTYAPQNIRSFHTSTDTRFKGKTWREAGKLWLDVTLEEIGRYMSNEMLALCGTGAMVGIAQLAEYNSEIQLRPGNIAYGITVTEWNHPTVPPLLFKTHPLFSLTDNYRWTVVLLDTRNIVERYTRQTRVTRDNLQQDGGPAASLARKEGWLTVAGLEFHHPETFAILDGIGLDNTMS